MMMMMMMKHVQLWLIEWTPIKFLSKRLAIVTEVVRLNIHPSTAAASIRLAGTGQPIQQELLGVGTPLIEVQLDIITSFCNGGIAVTA
jgi:hypothetical protein